MPVESDKCIFVTVHVDDFFVFASHLQFILGFKLQDKFKLKDLGRTQKCLGINVTCNDAKSLVCLDQSDYIKAILQKFQMEDSNPTKTPMEKGIWREMLNTKFERSSNFDPDRYDYQSLIGCLIYLTQGTRPDLAYTVSFLSGFNTSYTKEHWDLAKKVLKYLIFTRDHKLTYRADANEEILGYSDASYGLSVVDPRSISGYIFVLQGAPISWHSGKQELVAKSATEAELAAYTNATSEAIWLKNIMVEVKLMKPEPILILCDNAGAIELIKNAKFSSNTRHIIVKYFFVKERISSGDIKIEHISTKEMLTDFLTKCVSSNLHENFLWKINMRK